MPPTDRCSSLLGRLLVIALILLLCLPASAEWKESVVYEFQGGTDGQTPVGSVVFDKSGNLYGATTNGGADDCSPMAACGTVFELTPPQKAGDPWTETVLYVFKGAKYGDGDLPAGGLLIDGKGNLYGTTAYGGTGSCIFLGIAGGCGTVYELSPPPQPGGAWTEAILYSFPTPEQGQLPNGDLVSDADGNIYGATQFGGGYGSCDPFYAHCGTIFELSPPGQNGGAWTAKLLHSFPGTHPGPLSNGSSGDGSNPPGGLVLDNAGNVYGTTQFGGDSTGLCNGGVGGTGCGTVFELRRPADGNGMWAEVTLLRFNGMGGSGPAAGVVLDKSGNLYGTTAFGPPQTGGWGLIFELTKPGAEGGPWTENILHAFQGGQGGGKPMGPVTLDPDGTVYATASTGGLLGGGMILGLERVTSSPERIWQPTMLWSFSNVEEYPDAKLVWHQGALYSTTGYGGDTNGPCASFDGCGTVYELRP